MMIISGFHSLAHDPAPITVMTARYPLRRLAVGASAAWAAPIAATVYEDGILTSVFDARISWHHALILAVTIVGMVVIGRICVPALR